MVPLTPWPMTLPEETTTAPDVVPPQPTLTTIQAPSKLPPPPPPPPPPPRREELRGSSAGLLHGFKGHGFKGHGCVFSRQVLPECCLGQIAQWRPKGAGKAGRRRHPWSVRYRSAHGVDRWGGRSPGLPCADGFNGVLRALPGERCTIAPVTPPMADARARSGRHITARLDAQTPGVRTTRLLRPRTVPPDRRGLACAHP